MMSGIKEMTRRGIVGEIRRECSDINRCEECYRCIWLGIIRTRVIQIVEISRGKRRVEIERIVENTRQRKSVEELIEIGKGDEREIIENSINRIIIMYKMIKNNMEKCKKNYEEYIKTEEEEMREEKRKELYKNITIYCEKILEYVYKNDILITLTERGEIPEREEIMINKVLFMCDFMFRMNYEKYDAELIIDSRGDIMMEWRNKYLKSYHDMISLLNMYDGVKLSNMCIIILQTIKKIKKEENQIKREIKYKTVERLIDEIWEFAKYCINQEIKNNKLIIISKIGILREGEQEIKRQRK
jgi:hypothetical protein